MIRVCHIVNHITGKADGVYTHLKMIFQNYDRKKFQHYLIFQGGKKVEKELSEMGIEFFVCDSLKRKISINSFFEIYKIIKQNNISIIHSHFIKPYAIAGLVNIFLKKKFIFNYHGLFIYNNIYYGAIERSIYDFIHVIINIFRKPDVVLVPSKRSKEQLMKQTKLFPEPVVYYNGYNSENHHETDAKLFEDIERLKNENAIIAFVGRLDIDKRVNLAIQIFSLVKEKNNDVHFLIFGDGKREIELRKLVDELNLSEYVHFYGYVEGMKNYYKLFDVVLFTSRWEGMPLTMWEAMANEIPVIAPDVGGFREILEENNCGIIYNPNDKNEAAERLNNLLQDSILRKELGENGLKSVKEKYNGENFIKQIENIYSDLCN